MMPQMLCCLLLGWAWLVTGAVGCGLCVEAGEGAQSSFTCTGTVDRKVHYSVEVSDEELRLSCSDVVDVDFSLMNGCDFSSVTHVQFLGCPLPTVSYQEVLQKIGVQSGNLISLTASVVAKKGVLTQQHLQGLKELQLLHLAGIHAVANNSFTQTAKLEIIEICNGTLNDLPPYLFHNLTKLETVMLHRNDIVELPPELFSSTPGLLAIHLQENNISSLQEGLFKGLTFLKTLNISKNKIEKLSSGIFSDTSAMETLDLSRNLISEIETNTFVNTMVLKRLNLGYNQLRALPPGTLEACHSLEWLKLNNNNLTHAGLFNAFPEVPSLIYLDLGHNDITIEDMYIFALNNQNKVKHLLLNNNNISVMPDALNFAFINLETLDLSWNVFKYLEFSALIFLTESIKLNLKHNKIKTLDFRWSSLSVEKKLNLALEGNQLGCDCENYGFLRVLQGKPYPLLNDTLHIEVEDIDEVFCQFSDGAMENLMDVTTEDLTCQLAIDDICSFAWRFHDSMLIIDCSYLNLTSVQSLNFTAYQDDEQDFTLILANNSLTSLDSLQNYSSLRNLSMAYNKLSSLNVSHIPPHLKALDVRGNNLTTLPFAVLSHLNTTDMSLKLGSNPWHCDCDLLDLFRFLHVPSRKVSDFTQLQCAEDGEALMNLNENDLCPFFLQPMVIVTIVAILIFLILFAVLGTVSFYKYKQGIKVWLYAHHMCLWAITEDELDADKKYDAFISYSHKDEEFVMKVLVPGLECGEPRYRVCLHYRDWVPGEYIQNQIMQSVEASRRTIVVLSSNFIESVWGQLEFRAAHSQALQDRTNRIIVIVYGKIPSENDLDEKLKLYITTKTYVRWGDNKFWEKLRYIMPHPPDLVQKKHRKRRDTDKLELCKSTSKQEVC
ncbi:protein toll-like [Eriocheir sinensis]|uniref:protein toll-like n=1 Tax=Eriocheir sinensis TaxID=95602 RepID=UPI0021CA5418|nr:protein toll-like [Eriocheir sinensis]